MHVHQHGVISLHLQPTDGLQAIDSRVYLNASQYEEIGRHFEIERIVVHHQHLFAVEQAAHRWREHAAHLP
ncbi:hypothetical protein D3C72_2183500 [compost metagenome]